MTIREAINSDIDQIQSVRNSVTENTLSDTTLIPNKMVEEYIQNRGKGWVCTIQDQVVGFSIADLKESNVWALFVSPNHEGKGIGKILHDTMLNWYFEQTQEVIWLGTSPKTRAEGFYRKSGWIEVGIHGDGEIKFEMTYEDWERRSF